MILRPEAYVMTRGTSRRLDYNFLGAPPPKLWWRPLGDSGMVLLEQPEVIAYGDGTGLSLLVSGVPSRRRDMIGTAIRYTLVVDHLQADVDLARRLASAGLSAEGRTLLGRSLDEKFDEARVDAVLSGSADGSDVGELLADVFASPGWSGQADGSGEEIPGTWVGPAADGAARAGFIARVGALAAGERGFAFTSHALTSSKGAEAAASGLTGVSAILLVDSELERVMHLGKVRPEPPPKFTWRLPLAVAAAVSVAVAVAATILVLVLVL